MIKNTNDKEKNMYIKKTANHDITVLNFDNVIKENIKIKL